MEAFKFSCAQCGQHLSATADQVGISAPCPSCGFPVVVPTPVSPQRPPPLPSATQMPEQVGEEPPLAGRDAQSVLRVQRVTNQLEQAAHETTRKQRIAYLVLMGVCWGFAKMFISEAPDVPPRWFYIPAACFGIGTILTYCGISRGARFLRLLEHPERVKRIYLLNTTLVSKRGARLRTSREIVFEPQRGRTVKLSCPDSLLAEELSALFLNATLGYRG